MINYNTSRVFCGEGDIGGGGLCITLMYDERKIHL